MEGCCIGFTKFCTALLTSSDPKLREIPNHILQQVLKWQISLFECYLNFHNARSILMMVVVERWRSPISDPSLSVLCLPFYPFVILFPGSVCPSDPPRYVSDEAGSGFANAYSRRVGSRGEQHLSPTAGPQHQHTAGDSRSPTAPELGSDTWLAPGTPPLQSLL